MYGECATGYLASIKKSKLQHAIGWGNFTKGMILTNVTSKILLEGVRIAPIAGEVGNRVNHTTLSGYPHTMDIQMHPSALPYFGHAGQPPQDRVIQGDYKATLLGYGTLNGGQQTSP